MSFEDFVEHMRQEVREEGFIAAIELAGRIRTRLGDWKDNEVYDIDRTLSQIECEDIHRVQYTNSIAVNRPNVKDLYYYNPWGK